MSEQKTSGASAPGVSHLHSLNGPPPWQLSGSRQTGKTAFQEALGRQFEATQKAYVKEIEKQIWGPNPLIDHVAKHAQKNKEISMTTLISDARQEREKKRIAEALDAYEGYFDDDEDSAIVAFDYKSTRHGRLTSGVAILCKEDGRSFWKISGRSGLHTHEEFVDYLIERKVLPDDLIYQNPA